MFLWVFCHILVIERNKSIVYTQCGKKISPSHTEFILSGDLIIVTTYKTDKESFEILYLK